MCQSQIAASESFAIDRFSSEARTALFKGALPREDGDIRVRAVELLVGAGGREVIVFQKIETSEKPSASEKVRRVLISIRAISLTATLTPCFAVLADGLRRGERLRYGVALSAVAGALFLQIAINLYNDVSDYVKLIDLPGTPGGSGAFDRGWTTPREILGYARVAAALGVAAGVPALLAYPFQIAAIGLLGLGGALLYSNERFGLKYHALGDLAVLVLCGPALTAGFSYAAFGKLIPSYLLSGFMLGLLACSLLHVNNLQDIDIDRARGASTLATRFGFTASVRLLVVMNTAAFLIPVLAVARGIFPSAALIVLFAAIPAWKMARKIRRSLGPACPSLAGVRIAAAQIHLLAGILLSVGIAIGALYGR
jgi:1,4-dihydroxy-2-naphthoate octaprenyltransferase